MAKFLLLISAFLLLNSSTYSQDKIIFNDNFKNNNKKWVLRNDSNFLVNIKDGFLHLEKYQTNKINNGCLWYHKKISRLNTLNDFSITLYTRLLSGGEQGGSFDIQWGAWVNEIPESNKSFYQLNFWVGKEVRVDHFNMQSKRRWTSGERENIRSLLDSSTFNPTDINKYDIVQRNGFISFSINDIEYYKKQFTPIQGDGIGFLQCLKSAWEIDKIIIRQAKKKSKPTFSLDPSLTFQSGGIQN